MKKKLKGFFGRIFGAVKKQALKIIDRHVMPTSATNGKPTMSLRFSPTMTRPALRPASATPLPPYGHYIRQAHPPWVWRACCLVDCPTPWGSAV